MIAERQTHAPIVATPAVVAVTNALGKAWGCWWWLLRAQMADRHLLPRDEALGPAPARWLGGWPRDRR
jgi:hypothetical protein